MPAMFRSVSDVRVEWIWVMLQASWRLAVGSGILLAGAVLALGIGPILAASGPYALLVAIIAAFGIIPLIVGAVFLQAFGWVALADGSGETGPMRATFAVSLVGFVFGVILFLVAVPSVGFFLLGGGWILMPFAPIVFGPVVVAHGVLYLLAWTRIRSPVDSLNAMAIGGCLPLLTLGAVALALVLGAVWRLEGPFFAVGPILLMAGLTSGGYGLLAFSLSGEYERRRQPLAVDWYGTPSRSISPPGPR